MYDNISPSMTTLSWDELLDLENKWADESLNSNFRLGLADDKNDVYLR